LTSIGELAIYEKPIIPIPVTNLQFNGLTKVEAGFSLNLTFESPPQIHHFDIYQISSGIPQFLGRSFAEAYWVECVPATPDNEITLAVGAVSITGHFQDPTQYTTIKIAIPEARKCLIQ